jgi:hypothetical protein
MTAVGPVRGRKVPRLMAQRLRREFPAKTMSTAVANTSIELLTTAVLKLQAGASLSSGTWNLSHVQDAR